MFNPFHLHRTISLFRKSSVKAIAGLALPVLVAVLVGLVVYPTGASRPQAEPDLSVPVDHEHGVQGEPVKPVRVFELSQLRKRSLPDASAPDISAQDTQKVHLVAAVSRTYPFAWPAVGYMTSYMGPEHPLGIDIGLDYGSTSPITAMARGTVSLAGGNPEVGYGYFVTVDHGDGLVTLYAHFSEILVQEGQAVVQGETLGYGGSTGKSSGKHLHFEVRHQGYLVDPLDLLPQDPQEPEALTLDCEQDALVIDRGSTARLDFGQSLPEGTEIGAVTLTQAGGGGAVLANAQLTSASAVVIDTPPGLSDLLYDYEDTYTLELVLQGEASPKKSECEIQVRTRSSAPTAFVLAPDASIPNLSVPFSAVSQGDGLIPPEASDAEAGEGFQESEPTPEGTPQEALEETPEVAALDEPESGTPIATELVDDSATPGETATAEPPTATPTVETFAAPTQTPVPATSTPSPSPTSTPTEIPPTPTATTAPATVTPAPPTATATPVFTSTPLLSPEGIATPDGEVTSN